MTNVVNFSNRQPGRPVADGTQPPHDGGMEARVAKLESDVSYIQRDVGDIKADLRGMNDTLQKFGGEINAEFRELRTDVAAIKERINHSPTKLEMWTAVAVVVAAVGGGVLWIVQQYLGPILTKAAGG